MQHQPLCQPGASCIQFVSGEERSWRMVLWTRSDFNGGEVGRYGRYRGPASFLVEAQLLENGSLSQERLQSSRGVERAGQRTTCLYPLLEPALPENGSLSPNGLSARAGSKPEERIDSSDPVGVHSLENGSLSWNGCPSRERRTGCQIELACGVPGDAKSPVLWRMVL